MSWRPSTLADIANRARDGADFGQLTREFVDEIAGNTPQQLSESLGEILGNLGREDQSRRSGGKAGPK